MSYRYLSTLFSSWILFGCRWVEVSTLSSPAFSSLNTNVQAFLQSPSFLEFQRGGGGDGCCCSIICANNVFSRDDVCRWKRDALALKAAGFGVSGAGVASKTADIRKGVHQIWLQSPGSPTPTTLLQNTYVGDIDARKRLFHAINEIRGALNEDDDCSQNKSKSNKCRSSSRSLPPDLVELSYLLYDEYGASYAKHIDCRSQLTKDKPQRTPFVTSKRSVSFLLYLGGDSIDDDNVDDSSSYNHDWDEVSHGGALRVHGNEHSSAVASEAAALQPGLWADIAPTPGRMVLFDSASVLHEVMPTVQRRYCIVGWFRAPCKEDAVSGN